MTAPGESSIVVVEDVWGRSFDELSTRYRVLRHPNAWDDPGQLAELLETADAMVVRNRTTVDAALLALAPNLRVVARAGVGLDNIDVAAAHARGVAVVTPRGANSVSVAEHALTLALALARRLCEMDRATRAGGWRRTVGRELAGRTWGLLGLGATGAAVAQRAVAFGMQVVGHDPYVDATLLDRLGIGLELAGLEETLRRADVLSLHLPSTPATRALLDEDLLALLPEGALLISVGRGDVIDEQALVRALVDGRLGGAGLDVRATEPPAPGLLETLDNVILTPHVAGMTVESQTRIEAAIARDVDRVLQGQPPLHEVGDVGRWSAGTIHAPVAGPRGEKAP